MNLRRKSFANVKGRQKKKTGRKLPFIQYTYMYMLRIFHNQNFENTASNSPPSFLYLVFFEKYTFNVKRPTTISRYQLFPTRKHVRIPPKLAT